MEVREAVGTFIQSEKIKSGLIWTHHALQGYDGLAAKDRPGADHMLRMFIGMISAEVSLARNITPSPKWDEAQRHIEKALVMVNSKVAAEAAFHLTNALSAVTGIGQGAMTVLKDNGLV